MLEEVPVGAGRPSAAALVDWRAVVRLATAATPAGPQVSPASRRAVVALLRRSALEAPAWVAQITGLRRAAQEAAESTQVLVVDRAGMIMTAAASLRRLLEGVPAPVPVEAGWRLGPARAVASAQLAGLLGPWSTRLLGQVLPREALVPAGAVPLDGEAGSVSVSGAASALTAGVQAPASVPVPVASAAPEVRAGASEGAASSSGATGSRMLLVAPNVLAFQQRMELDRLDLPAWVTLHEATHAVQLAQAPWLGEYLRSRMSVVVAAVVGALRLEGGGSGPGRLLRLLHGRQADPLAVVLGVEGQQAFAELSAVLALLEGHAEAVLDSVTPARLPSAHRLRQVMAHRRVGGSVGPGAGLSGLVGRLVRLADKEAQYVDGGAFVRALLSRVGHEGLNRVWAGPELLPTPAELAAPETWLERLGLG